MAERELGWFPIALLLGAIQGFLLAAVLATQRRNQTANRLLAIAILYPDPKDGWYLNAGGTFHGVVGGVTIGRVEVVGRLGMRRTETFKEVAPPMYGGLGVGVGF